MPYLYSPEVGPSDHVAERRGSNEAQQRKSTKCTNDIDHWLTKVGCWASTDGNRSLAFSSIIGLDNNDIKPPRISHQPLELASRSFEGGDWYRWSGHWYSSVAKRNYDDWYAEEGTVARRLSEAEDAGIVGVGKDGDDNRLRFGRDDDDTGLKAVKGGTCREPDAVQRSGDVRIPVDGHWLPAEGKGVMLLRWMMQSSEEDPWHVGKVKAILG
jgi:hypothetical protein